MTMREEMEQFSARYGKALAVDGVHWRYHRLGTGMPVLWLTGGLRRAALASTVLERLAARHTVIAPDYPPLRTLEQFMAGFDAILEAEGIEIFAVVGQSYGGMLAQAYLAHRPQDVQRLILSSSGPADYGPGWLSGEIVAISLVRLLPERALKALLYRALVRLIGRGGPQDVADAIKAILEQDLSRADVVSHFAVAGDLIRTKAVSPVAFRHWNGRVVVLTAENDPTQKRGDVPRYQRLFGRPVEVVSLGQLGHVAPLSDPDAYTSLLERALG